MGSSKHPESFHFPLEAVQSVLICPKFQIQRNGSVFRAVFRKLAFMAAEDCLLLGEEGKMKGSALVIDFDSPEALKEYLDSEPYIKTGVWQDVESHRMNVVIFDGAKVK